MASSSPHRADIDGLRALAVGLVLVFHFRLVPGLGDAGFLGVDVFFVISGYLITRIVVRDLQAGRFGFADFYLRRVRRLAPALLVTLAGVLLVGWHRLLPLEFDELLRQAVATQLYVANVYFWKNVSYFGLAADQTLLLHTWSLAVEEQFYLLYPLALWAVYRTPWLRGRLLALVVTVCIASFAVNVGLSLTKPSAAFYLLPSRAWQLLAGAWLALLPVAAARPAARSDAMALAGLALLVVAVVGHHPGLPTPGFWALLPVAAAVLLIRAGDGGTGRLSRWLGVAPLAFIGRISYPAYLVHWPLHVLAGAEWGDAYHHHAGWRWALLGVTLVAAAVIHLAVELPVQRLSIAGRGRRWASGYATSVAAALALFAASAHSGGLPGRFSPEVARLASAVLDRPPPLTECEWAPGRPVGAGFPCVIGQAPGAPRWLVYGDSHAWAAYPALVEWLAQRGESALFSFRHGCPPLVGVHLPNDRGVCAAYNDAMLALLQGAQAPKQVLMISTWLQAAEGLLLPAPDARGSVEQSLQLFHRQFGATLQALHARGAEVWVWAPVPGAREGPPAALARALLHGRPPPPLAWSEAEYRDRHAFFFDAVVAQGQHIARVVEPASVLCAEGTCPVVQAGRPLYTDSSHVSRAAAPLLVAALQGAHAPASGEAGR